MTLLPLMFKHYTIKKKYVLLFLFLNTAGSYCMNELPIMSDSLVPTEKLPTGLPQIEEYEEKLEEEVPSVDQPRRIIAIKVHGNQHVPEAAILYRLPYKVGEIFNPQKTNILIRKLYYELRRFRNIMVSGQPIGDDQMILHITVVEKYPLKEVMFQGNKQISEKDIRSKIKFEDIPAIDQEELNTHARAIQKLYLDKGYHRVQIIPELIVDEDGTATAVFNIREFSPSLVKQIDFIGNKCVSSKKLRSIVLTKEDWILGLMDKSGTYIPDRLEADKYMIEQYYQNNGYLYAKVIDVITDTNPNTGNIKLTFEIQEGNIYTFGDVKVPGNEILPEEFLRYQIPFRTGEIYSREKVGNAIKNLEMLWGNFGYSYAHIEPSVQPNDETRTVNVSFHTELGKKVHLNRLNILGNKKTRDKIVRRTISLQEGELITNAGMEVSKQRVESLGYFEQRDGVNWKMTRISEDLADLDLIVKEAKTGSANIKIGFGGAGADLKSPASGFSTELNVADSNLFGSGIKLNITGRLAKDDKSFFFSVAQPWLFDKPYYGQLDIYHRRLGYDELRYTRPVTQSLTGGSLTAGFYTGLRRFTFFNDTAVKLSTAFNHLKNDYPPQANIVGFPLTQECQIQATETYQALLDKLFMPGEYVLLSGGFSQDQKNHPMHPTRGHTWRVQADLALAPGDIITSCKIGYTKVACEFNYWTPLIDEFSLIFHLKGYLGVASQFKNRTIPYNELYHIGGPASVRGFLYGQIGPQFSVYPGVTDSIGGSKAMFVNAEIIFPITADFSMKGLFFYDGGTSWDNPYSRQIPSRYLHVQERDGQLGRNTNHFDYRHAVGFGLRILNPMPIRVDWGFKLDPRPGESTYEVHFGTNVDW